MNIDIIGAGIGGLAAAITIKKGDNKINVVVHEKNKEVGFNPEGRRCGEAYTMYKELKKWRPADEIFFNKIKFVELQFGSKVYKYSRVKEDSFIINRQKFINNLSKNALKLGVEIKTNDKIKQLSDLDGDYIIDGSGCPSVIKKNLGLKNGLKCLGYQQTLENSKNFNRDTVKLFYFGSTGYYWIFPRNPDKKEINVGVGILFNQTKKIKEMLSTFIKNNHIEGKINYTTGGFIPMGLQKPLNYQNVLFVGDAGVGTFPLTGEGICRAILSGEAAGHCIIDKKPYKYSSIIKKLILKWDIIGVNFLKFHNLSLKVGPNASSLVLNIMSSINHKLKFIKFGE